MLDVDGLYLWVKQACGSGPGRGFLEEPIKFKVACHLMSPRYMSSASSTHAGPGKPEGKDMVAFGGMPSAEKACQVFLPSETRRALLMGLTVQPWHCPESVPFPTLH